MAHPTATTTDATDAQATFEELTTGDRIELPNHYENPMTVTFVGNKFVSVVDDDGNERSLVQAQSSHGHIGLIAGMTDKGSVTEIRRVERDEGDGRVLSLDTSADKNTRQ